MNSAGLVDLQVNGFAGIDFNAGRDLDAAAMDRALAAMLATGVTHCLPTIITAAPGVMRERLLALDAAVSASALGPAMCPGYHVEGPFLNPGDGYAGCHPAAAMTAPDPEFLERLEAGLDRPILLVTLAPELAGSLPFIRRARAAGRLVAVGHSAAGPAGFYPFAGMAIERGADGSVRVPSGRSLAGSSLCLDQAVRNLVAWQIATPPDALALAADRPLALLAPALLAHGLRVEAGAVAWSETWHPRRVDTLCGTTFYGTVRSGDST